MIRRLSSHVVVAAAAVLIAACGGAPPGNTPRPTGSRSADQANIAVQATDPRTGDLTAAGPAPMSPITGNTAPVTSGSPASGASASATPAAPPSNATGEDANESPSASSTAKTNAATPAKIGARHVLIQWMGSDRAPSSVVRSRDQAFAVAQEVLRRARNKEDFARLAIEFSDEPGAGGRGGSLGRFGRGQMVGAFEAAVFKLEVGQISDIVETPFGFHIIQRTE